MDNHIEEESLFEGMQGPSASPGLRERVGVRERMSGATSISTGSRPRWMAAAVLLLAGAGVFSLRRGVVPRPEETLAEVAGPLVGMPLPPFVTGAAPAQIPPTLKDCGPRVDGPYRVHEWGLIPLGQKDLSLGADLPEFAKGHVEAGGVSIPPTLKPILYFYPEKPACACFSPDVRISIPGGKMAYVWPPGNLPDERTLFYRHNILGLAPDPTQARPVPKGHWMETARDTDAIWLNVRAADNKGKLVNETERFLFYDGYVPYPCPLDAKMGKDGAVRVSHSRHAVDPIHDLLLIRNAKGRTSLAHAEHLATKEAVTLTAQPSENPAQLLTRLLVAASLYEKEAAGMAQIWKKDFFGRDGDWVLWRLSQTTVDALQPLELTPKPVEVVRVHLVLAPLSLLTGNP
jgi:hypothetical protein